MTGEFSSWETKSTADNVSLIKKKTVLGFVNTLSFPTFAVQGLPLKVCLDHFLKRKREAHIKSESSESSNIPLLQKYFGSLKHDIRKKCNSNIITENCHAASLHFPHFTLSVLTTLAIWSPSSKSAVGTGRPNKFRKKQRKLCLIYQKILISN